MADHPHGHTLLEKIEDGVKRAEHAVEHVIVDDIIEGVKRVEHAVADEVEHVERAVVEEVEKVGKAIIDGPASLIAGKAISSVVTKRVDVPDKPDQKFLYDHKTKVKPWPMLDASKGFPESQKPTDKWFQEVAAVALNLLVNHFAWELDPLGKSKGTGEVLHKLKWDHLDLDMKLDDVEGLEAEGEQLLTSMASTDDSTPGLKGLIKLAGKTLKKKGMVCPSKSMSLLKPSLHHKARTHGRPKSLDDYKHLFKTVKLPALSSNYSEDRIFADLRVAGFNPVVIKGVKKVPTDKFPVTDHMLASVTTKGDTLKKASKEGRLFLADYSPLVDSVMGDEPKGPKYIFAPLALFALPPGKGTRRLVPVAIQCGQDPKAFAIHTPDQKESELWSRAKTTVQIADAHYHELISHLAGTHLLIEPFVIATHNHLGVTHAIGRLLTPHFEGTLFINFGAVTALLGDDGGVARVLAPTIEASIKVSVEYLLQDDFFNAHILPNELKARDVMSEDLYYPYRDDALAIWNAICTWVKNYVSIFYKDDQAVEDDCYLQAWAKELVAEDGGRLKGFGELDPTTGKTVPGKLTTMSYLIEALTMVIFTASAGHATFNYGQQQMTYVPAVPGAAYRSMPRSLQQAATMPALDQYPPLEMAGEQLNLLLALSSIYYTRLGHYDEYMPINDEVKEALQAYNDNLVEVSAAMKEANRKRDPPYDILLPEKIPQSINI